MGRGDGEEGTPEAPEGGVGGDGGSISLLSPPHCSPLPAVWRCSEPDPAKPGLGAGAEPERPPAWVSGRRGRSPEVHGGWGKG